jgi:hypothetical protein
MNKKRLERLSHHIESLRDPRKFDMNDWLQERAECGTVACYGGFANLLFGLVPRFVVVRYSRGALAVRASHLLELNRVQSLRLFSANLWPSAFRHAYRNAERSGDFEAARQVSVERLRHFIITNGEE